MPIPQILEGKAQNVIRTVAGSLFWIGLVFGWIAWILNNHLAKQMKLSKAMPKRKQLNFIRAFTNVPTTVCDLAFLIALIGLVGMVCMHNTYGYWAYMDLFVLLLALQMHIVFCGRVFWIITHKSH